MPNSLVSLAIINDIFHKSKKCIVHIEKYDECILNKENKFEDCYLVHINQFHSCVKKMNLK